MTLRPVRRAVLVFLVLAAPFVCIVTTREPATAPPGHLGILTGPSEPRVTGVLPASPAEVAGLCVGDLVQSIDGVAVGDPHHLRHLVGSRRAGDRIVVRIGRNGEDLSVAVTLGGPGVRPD
jgi:S1-C subfamily serine protease